MSRPGLYKSHRASGCSDDAAVKFRMREISVLSTYVPTPPLYQSRAARAPLPPASVVQHCRIKVKISRGPRDFHDSPMRMEKELA